MFSSLRFGIVVFSLVAMTCVLLIGCTETLLDAVTKTAGVYKDPIRRTLDLNKTVLVTSCNRGYMNHLYNFKCFADRLGFQFLVVTLDERADRFLRENTTMTSYLMMKGIPSTAESTSYRSSQFNIISFKKKEVVHDILKLGYNVLFSDIDIAIVKDPISLMIWNNVDYVHSLNAACPSVEPYDFRRSAEGNTGFYFARSNNRTVKLWADAVKAAQRFPGLDDQAVFWIVIRQSLDPSVMHIGNCSHMHRSEQQQQLTACVLDSCEFSSGMLSRQSWLHEVYTYENLVGTLKLRNQSMYTVHANYIVDNHRKVQKMKEHGFWLATSHHALHHPVPHLKSKPATALLTAVGGLGGVGLGASVFGSNNHIHVGAAAAGGGECKVFVPEEERTDFTVPRAAAHPKQMR